VSSHIHSSMTNTVTVTNAQLTGDILSDDLSDDGSSPDSAFDPSELMDTAMSDEITSHLAAAGSQISLLTNKYYNVTLIDHLIL